MMQINIKVVQF